MNERDIELAKQAGFNPFDIEFFQSIGKWSDIIRADERGACLKIAESQRKNVEILTSFPPQSAAARNIEAMIHERGNT